MSTIWITRRELRDMIREACEGVGSVCEGCDMPTEACECGVKEGGGVPGDDVTEAAHPRHKKKQVRRLKDLIKPRK